MPVRLHGDAAKELDFELSGFTRTAIDISIIWLYYSAPLLAILWSLVILLALIGFGRIIIPKCVYLKQIRKGKQTELETAQAAKRNPTSMNRAAFLPASLSIPLLLLFAYPFIGPLLVGQFSSAHLGVAFLNQVFLVDTF